MGTTQEAVLIPNPTIPGITMVPGHQEEEVLLVAVAKTDPPDRLMMKQSERIRQVGAGIAE